MPAFPDGVTRRALLGAGAGLSLATAACSSRSGATAPPRTPTPASSGETSPDIAVATTALRAVLDMRAQLDSAATAYPGLRVPLRDLRTVHLAHARSLQDAVPAGAGSRTSTPVAMPTGDRDRALRIVLRQEQRLHDTLGGLALRARSGDFARLLAAMGTAITLQLAVLEAGAA